MKENALDSKVFQDELDFKTLENILETLDHVTPKKVSRSDFNARKGNFLVETGEDKFGKQYDLFLPEDLVSGELLHLIDFLSQKFGIENYTPYGRIITQTKVMVGVILRGMGEDDGEKYLQELAQKYSLSPEFIARLKSQKEGGDKMSFPQAKEMIKSVKSRREIDNKEKVGKNPNDIILGFEELKELYGEEFDLTFFRKGVNMLRLGMMTMTQAEQKVLKERGVGEGEVVSFHVSENILDEKERLLRDKIGIDELKQELDEVRKFGNQEQINEAELKAINRILEVLYEYPYQLTQNNYGFQSSKIVESKEIYCVGFSLLGHAFLNELGIQHYGLDIEDHSALGITIGGKQYYFDITKNQLEYKRVGISIYEMSTISEVTYSQINFLWLNGFQKRKAKKVNDVDNFLLAQIINNSYDNQERNNRINNRLGISSLNMSIGIYPGYYMTYRNKGILYERLGNKKLYKLYLFASKYLFGEKNNFEILYRKEKAQIKKLIDSQDFEGLRLYLLELEKQDN